MTQQRQMVSQLAVLVAGVCRSLTLLAPACAIAVCSAQGAREASKRADASPGGINARKLQLTFEGIACCQPPWALLVRPWPVPRHSQA